MISRLHVTAGALLATAALITGCGSSPSSASAGTSATSPPASAAAAASAAATTSPAAAAAPAAGGFCAVVKKNLKEVTGQQMTSLLTGGTPAAWKAYLAAVADANQQLADGAPAEIRPAMETLQQDSAKLLSLLAAAGYDMRKVGDMSQLIKDLGSPRHVAAAKALTAYVKTNCGIDLSTPPA